MGKIADKRVRNYIEKVKKKFNAQVILFGSRTSKDALKESDYDICVLSDKFEGVPLRKRLQELYLLMLKDPFNADILALTPKEYEKLSTSITIYKTIKQTGVIC